MHQAPQSALAGDFGAEGGAGSSAIQSPYSARYVWYVVGLITVVNACNYMDRMALAVLAPSIQQELHLSDGQFGLLTGFAFALFYAICGIPVARWADSGSRRDIISIALATWSVMTAVSGAAQNFWHLFLARVGIGAGEAGGAAPAGSLLCDFVPLRRRPLMFAIQAFGFFAGMTIGIALAGRLVEEIGWRMTFVVLGLPGLVLAAIVRLTLQEPQRGLFEQARDDGKPESFRATLDFLRQCRSYRLLLCFVIINGFVQSGLQQWWPSFYVRTFELSSSSVGTYLGLAIGVGSGVGMIVGGMLANRAAQRDVTLPLKIGMGTLALALPAAAGSILVPTASVSLGLVAITMVLLTLPFGAIAANLYSVAKPRMRSMAGAIALFGTSAIGYGLGPLCVGVLSDLVAETYGMHSLRYAMLVPVAFLPLLVIVLKRAVRTLHDDLQATGSR